MTVNTTPSDNSGTPPVTAGVFEQLVGPGKKFDTQEALARGKQESDQFIEKVLAEKREALDLAQRLAQENDSLKVKASILDRINPQNQSGNQSGTQGTNPTPASTPAVGLSAEDVVKLIESSKQHEAAQSNIRTADAALIKALGSDAPAYVKQRATEMGMDVQDLYKVATKSPAAFLNMLGINPNQTNAAGGMYNQSNRPGPNGNNPELRNEAYYNKLKSQMGVLKFVQDSRVQVQMHKDMQALGDSYFVS